MGEMAGENDGDALKENVSAEALTVFTDSRSRMFGIAYRMLGSVAEAEDVVQEAWLRWQRTDHAEVRNPGGFLTTMTTRLAINSAESARSRREKYVGPWLPEPVDTSADPYLGAERAEALQSAVLLLLERVPARERAAYVLREAFDYSYPEIGEIVQVSEVNARQLVSRAKKHVQGDRKVAVDPAQHRALLEAFVTAAQEGDLGGLERLLSEQCVSRSDGAGITPRAARRPVVGGTTVARFVASFSRFWWEGTELVWLNTNSAPSVLIRRAEEPIAVLSIETSSEGIEQIMWVMVPEKLSRL